MWKMFKEIYFQKIFIFVDNHTNINPPQYPINVIVPIICVILFVE